MTADTLLVIDRRGCHVRLDQGRVRIDYPDGTHRSFPLVALGEVIVHGAATIDAGLLRALGEAAIPTVLVPGRGQGRATWLAGGLQGPVAVRQAQHRCHLDTECRRQQAIAIVRAKLDAQAGHLQARSLPPPPALRTDKLAHAPDLGALLGYEGAAAAAYFQVLASDLPPAWRFHGRNRRPPRDPVNALLSLGYTLLGAEMQLAVLGAGLDPALGMLHAVCPGRDALALDLIEPLRPGIDRFVLGLLDALQPDDFHTHAGTGCRLNKEARGRFYSAWATQRAHWAEQGGAAAATDAHGTDGHGTGPNADPSLPAVCRRAARAFRHALPGLDDVADEIDTPPAADPGDAP